LPVGPVDIGQEFEIVLLATNGGPDYARSAKIHLSVPLGLIFTGASLPSTSTSDGEVELDLGSLNVNTSRPIVIRFVAAWPGNHVLTPRITGDRPDPNPENDELAIEVGVALPTCDLSGEAGSVRLVKRLVGRRTREIITGTITVRSKGSCFGRNLRVAYCLSADDEVDPADLVVLSQQVRIPPENSERELSFVARLPRGVSASGKFLLARIDPGDRILEDSELNNTVVFGLFPQ
jgi:hypothetical protein